MQSSASQCLVLSLIPLRKIGIRISVLCAMLFLLCNASVLKAQFYFYETSHTNHCDAHPEANKAVNASVGDPIEVGTFTDAKGGAVQVTQGFVWNSSATFKQVTSAAWLHTDSKSPVKVTVTLTSRAPSAVNSSQRTFITYVPPGAGYHEVKLFTYNNAPRIAALPAATYWVTLSSSEHFTWETTKGKFVPHFPAYITFPNPNSNPPYTGLPYSATPNGDANIGAKYTGGAYVNNNAGYLAPNPLTTTFPPPVPTIREYPGPTKNIMLCFSAWGNLAKK